MKSVVAFLIALLAAPMAAAFSGSSFSGASLGVSAKNSGNSMTMEYIPSGMSKAQWAKVKEAEKTKKAKNLGKVGITTFKSRTFADWQKAGGINLFPVDPKSVKNAKDLPYMQRPGGSADDQDLKKKSFGGFNFGKKKKAAEPEPEARKTNWWTL